MAEIIIRRLLIITAVVLLSAAFCFLLRRREKHKRMILSMNPKRKSELLNELAEPFGFFYIQKKDIFVSRRNVWQRKEGYEALFDALAPKFGMIFDAWPVYFDYKEKTWLIEFWKGQYGINTGCEIGVYHTNRIVKKEQRRLVHYNAAADDELPLIQLYLEKDRKKLCGYENYHWWLTAFCMGTFSKPSQLEMSARISFRETEAAEAFYKGVSESGCPKENCSLHHHSVYVDFDRSRQYRGMKRAKRQFAQIKNKCFVKLYLLVTLPFETTTDKMLFLFYEAPFAFRNMLRLHSFGRKL